MLRGAHGYSNVWISGRRDRRRLSPLVRAVNGSFERGCFSVKKAGCHRLFCASRSLCVFVFLCVSVCVSVCLVCLCVCACLCVAHRHERHATERTGTHRDTQRHTDTHRDTHRHTHIHTKLGSPPSWQAHQVSEPTMLATPHGRGLLFSTLKRQAAKIQSVKTAQDSVKRSAQLALGG